MDLILYNGMVKTMNPAQPEAQAVAILDGKIAAVGTDAQILAMKLPQTELIDLGGNLTVPGFNDAHMHLTMFGASLQECNLYNTTSVEELVEKVRRFIAKRNVPPGTWVIGKGWHQDYFTVKEMPTRQQLDLISTEHPICLMNAGFHALAANTAALERAGLSASTPDVEGGFLGREADGFPNGVFKESAMNLIYDKLPQHSYEDIKTFIRDACAYANRCGITSIQTDDFLLPGVHFDQILRAYRELNQNREIHVRVYEQCNLPSVEALQEFLSQGHRTGRGDERFRIGPYKLIADGNIGGRTAALCSPYADDDGNCGLPIYSQQQLDELVGLAHENNMQVATHCIGDKASYMALESYQKALKAHPRADHRHTLLHCQILDGALVDRYRELGVVASVQPIFLHYDLHVVEGRIGKERVQTSYNWRTLLDAGVSVAFGSDCPVEPMDVTPGIYCAVTRKDLKGVPEDGWYPDERLAVEEALYAFTQGAAYASFEEDCKGSLEVGKYADLVVLQEDIFTIPPDRIKDVTPALTIMDGAVVYRANNN